MLIDLATITSFQINILNLYTKSLEECEDIYITMNKGITKGQGHCSVQARKNNTKNDGHDILYAKDRTEMFVKEVDLCVNMDTLFCLVW